MAKGSFFTMRRLELFAVLCVMVFPESALCVGEMYDFFKKSASVTANCDIAKVSGYEDYYYCKDGLQPGEWNIIWQNQNEQNLALLGGTARCSNVGNSKADAAYIGNPGTATKGQYCWCRAQYYALNNGQRVSFNGDWVLFPTIKRPNECLAECTTGCVSTIKDELVFRQMVMGTLAHKPINTTTTTTNPTQQSSNTSANNKSRANSESSESSESTTETESQTTENVTIQQATTTASVDTSIQQLKNFFNGVNRDKWKTVDGKFNTGRLVSDLTAGVVLGTVGGVVSGVVIKKKQLEKGFDALHCSVSGQSIANWGDEFIVELKR